MWISKREYASLQKQVEFWQERAQAEQVRADNAINQALLEAGRAPVPSSVASVSVTTAEMKKAAEEMLAQFKLGQEMNVDDDGSEFIVGDRIAIEPEALAALVKGGK